MDIGNYSVDAKSGIKTTEGAERRGKRRCQSRIPRYSAFSVVNSLIFLIRLNSYGHCLLWLESRSHLVAASLSQPPHPKLASQLRCVGGFRVTRLAFRAARRATTTAGAFSLAEIPYRPYQDKKQHGENDTSHNNCGTVLSEKCFHVVASNFPVDDGEWGSAGLRTSM
jgi:hypothetical protein